MSFFPNLSPLKGDVVDTTNIDYGKDAVLPSLPAIGYYSKKKVRGLGEDSNVKDHKQAIIDTCSGFDWVCDYSNISGSDSQVASPSTMNTITATEIKTAFGNNTIHPNLTNYVDDLDETKIACQIPNMLVHFGYKFSKSITSNDSTIDEYTHQYTKDDKAKTAATQYIYLKKADQSNATKANDQTRFNACQTVMSRSRQYDISKIFGGLFFGMKDIFTKLKSIRPILIVVLAIAVYLLVNGTLASADLGFNIANLISSRSNSTFSYFLGIFVGILIPAIICLISAKKQIDKTNAKYSSGVDITTNPYGDKVDDSGQSQRNDIALISIMLGVTYVCIALIYYIMRDKVRTPLTKAVIGTILLLFLAVCVFLIFYWTPIVSYGADNADDAAYGISRPLRIWVRGGDDKDIRPVMSNKHIDYYLGRFFAIYAIVTIVIATFYLKMPARPLTGFGDSMVEGIMATCAILAIPILWVFNWYVGMKFFIGYPMFLMIIRFFRYPMYYIMRSIYLGSPDMQRSYPHLRIEFNKPESYTAPWDLLGVTIFKNLIKFSSSRLFYSDSLVDPRDGYKDIAGNSYTTGHFFRMFMKDQKGPFDYYHHSLVFLITIIVMAYLMNNVVGSA
jgi:uncharacterized BrkB/YihY/UPF0761 family membrane protein